MSRQNATTIDHFLDSVDEVGLFPGASMRILHLSRSKSATIDDLVDVVSTDAVLAGRVLKVANSPLMGRRMRIGSLNHAVKMLGFDGTRDISLALAVSGVTQRDTRMGRYLWQHAEMTAWVARVLGENVRRSDPDSMFVAGLLHDLGLQILLAIDPRRTTALLDQFDPHSDLILKAEKLHYGFTHAELGSALLRRWRLPAFSSVLVEFHHERVLPPGGAADPRSHAMMLLSDTLADGVIDGLDAQTLVRNSWEHPAREGIHMTDAALERALSRLIEHRDEIVDGLPAAPEVV